MSTEVKKILPSMRKLDLKVDFRFAGVIFFYIGVALEFYLSYIDLWSFAPSNYFFMMALGCSVLSLNSETLLKVSKFKSIIFLIPAFVIWDFLGDFFIRDHVLTGYYLKPLLKFWPLVFLPLLVLRDQKIENIAKAFVFIGAITAATAMLQWLGFDFAWQARRIIEPNTFDSIISYQRPSSLALYFNTLAEQMMVCYGFAYYLFRKFQSRRTYRVLYYIILVGLVLSFTRSSVLGAFFFHITLTALMRNDRKFNFARLAEFLTIVFIFNFVNQYDEYIFKEIKIFLVKIGFIDGIGTERGNTIKLFRFDASAGARIYLWLAGLKAFLLNPFLGLGSTSDNYLAILKENQITFSSDLWGMPGRDQVLKHRPHNYFLKFLIDHGIFLFTLLLWSLSDLLKRLYLSKKSEALCLLGIIIMVSVSSMFHNSGLFNSTIPVLAIGISLLVLSKQLEK
jgi:hypothetical protein